MNRQKIVAAVLGLVFAAAAPAVRAEVVYQNNDVATRGSDHGFGSPGNEGGDQITLAGSCRVITQLELAHIAAPGTIDLIVRLYANDGPVSPDPAAGNEPGTLLWDSGSLPITGATPASSGFQIFTVAVPNVTVPDTFTWTIERADGATISLPRVGPPTTGSSSSFIWAHFPTNWSPNQFASVPVNSFYAVVTAAGGTAGITCPADAVVDCGGDASPTVTGTATATGCGTVTVSSSDVLAASCGAAGTITRTWTANDGSPTPSTCTQLIQIIDNTPPVLAGVPAGFPVGCNAVPPAANPTATDGCGAAPVAVAFSETNVPGACAQSFALHRTWTATDACGNSTSATQIITVQDTTAPTFTGVPVGASAECDAVPARVDPTVIDNCDSAAVTSFTETTTGTCGATVITRTWTATDACGNSNAVSQTINVTDTTPPVATATLIFASAGDEEGKPHDDDEGMFQVVASCSDNCAGSGGCTAPVLTAELQCWGGGVIAVNPGDIVEIEMDDEGCDIEIEGGKIEIEGDVTLVVTCTDATGNTTQATAAPLGLQPDNDDEWEDDD